MEWVTPRLDWVLDARVHWGWWVSHRRYITYWGERLPLGFDLPLMLPSPLAAVFSHDRHDCRQSWLSTSTQVKKKKTLYPLFTVTLPFVPLKPLVGLHWISAVIFNVTLLPVSLDGSSVFSFADQCSLRQIQANSLQFNKLLILNWVFLWESDVFVGQKHGSTFCERFLLSFITFQQPLKAWCPLNPLIQIAIRLFVCTHLVPWMNWNSSFFGQINSYMIIETLVEGLLPFNGKLVVKKKFQSSQINGGGGSYI